MFEGLKELPATRGQLGLIIPSSNRLTEPQMRRYSPAGVEVHVTRLRMTGASHIPLAELVPRIVEATQALDDARCDVIVFHCTASSMEAGLAGERLVLDSMRSDSVYAKTKEIASKSFGSITLETIKVAIPMALQALLKSQGYVP